MQMNLVLSVTSIVSVKFKFGFRLEIMVRPLSKTLQLHSYCTCIKKELFMQCVMGIILYFGMVRSSVVIGLCYKNSSGHRHHKQLLPLSC